MSSSLQKSHSRIHFMLREIRQNPNLVWTHSVCGKVIRAPSYWLRSSRYCTCRIPKPSFLCRGCGVNTSKINEYYMVHDHIWETAFAAENQECFSCIGCLEEALNRRLCQADFTLCPQNTNPDTKRSARLQQRLGIAK